MLSNTLRLNFCCLKIYYNLHPHYHPKIIGHILKKSQKNKYVCMQYIIRVTLMKMKMKMNKRSHRCDIIRPKFRCGHKHSTYKKFQYHYAYVLSNT